MLAAGMISGYKVTNDLFDGTALIVVTDSVPSEYQAYYTLLTK